MVATHPTGLEDHWVGLLGCRKRQSTDAVGVLPKGLQPEAALRLSKDAKPVFCKARSVPFALKEVVGSDLDRLEKEGILVKVSSSE